MNTVFFSMEGRKRTSLGIADHQKQFQEFSLNSNAMGNSYHKSLIKATGKFIAMLIALLVFMSSASAQLAGYSYKKKITIDNTRISGTSDLTDFPMLISFTDADLRTAANGGNVENANGYDIVFTDSDGSTLLNFDLEKYVSTTGEYAAWVRIPTLDHNDDTDIFMYYGNSSVSSDQSSTSAWNSDYQGVWHLAENANTNPNGYADATSNNNDGTGSSMSDAAVAGKIDQAASFDGAASPTGDYIDAGTSAGSSADLTVEFWMRADVTNQYMRPVSKLNEDDAGDQGWSFMVRQAGDVGYDRALIFRIGDRTDFGGWGNEISAQYLYNANQWVHVVGTFAYNGVNGGTGKLYVDGVEVASKTNADGRGVANTAASLFIGWDYSYLEIPSWLEHFDGDIDEVRVSDVAYDAGWIATNFNNQNDPTGFITLGTEYSTKVWIAGNGDWDTDANWSPFGAPPKTNSYDITIDCGCTVTYDINDDLEIDGSLYIGSGSTLDLDGEKFTIGANDNDAFITNDGTITNSDKISNKGDAVGFGAGPYIYNNGTITATDMHIGNNDGGGMLYNYLSGVVNTTAGGIHLDGSMCNEGNMFLNGDMKSHGGDIACCGYIETPKLDIDLNRGRPQYLNCTNICASGGVDPIIDIDGDVYANLLDAYNNAPATDVIFDPDFTYFCGLNKDGEPGPVTPDIQFNTASSSGLESVASTNIAVDISSVCALDITVDYTITGTATGTGTDYTLANGTLTIPSRDADNSENITISSIVDDLLYEGNETVIITLSNPVNANLGTNTVHTYTITDNETAPTIAFASASSSGAESTASADLTVNLNSASGLNASVDYAITGTATGGGTDYTLANGTLNILSGSTSGDITIASIVDDALDEANETVIVTLSNPTNAVLVGPSVHTYTITDNDPVPTIAFNTTSSSGAESVASTDLTVSLSAVSGRNVRVDYTVAGTATGGGTDYTLANGQLTIPQGSSSGTITIGSIVNDALDENNETVIVTLSSPVRATLGTNTVHTYTINDDDATPQIQFANAASNRAESVSSTDLAVQINAVSGLNVQVNYTVTGTATGAGTDYTLADGTLTILAGDADNSENITIASIVDDALFENNETVIVTLSAPTNATLGTNTVHTYTINDNDAAPTVAFNAIASNGDESVSSAGLTVGLTAVSGLNVTVDYAVTGTATGSGTDYTLANGQLSIPAGNGSGSIVIASIVDDLLDENNETVIVTLSNPVNATLGGNTVHTYTINDNDAAPTVQFGTTSSSGDESVSSAALAVNLSAASGLDVTVDYAVTGTATGSGTDFTLANGTLTIYAGSTSENITISSIVDDLLDENNETVIVTLSNANNASLGGNSVYTYTINDNDATPTIQFNSASSSGAESVGTANLAVDLSATSGLDVQVNYSVAGTATGGGTDYTLANGTLTILAGDADDSENITIASIVDDALFENNETVIVTLSAPTNATLGTNSVHTYTINDNDAAPIVAFANTASNGDESVNSAALTVNLNNASSLDVTVDYAVTGTATGGGTDYSLADGQLTILAGNTSGTITIASIFDDLLDENDETVIVTLSNPGNATLGGNTVHTYTINDNDATPAVQFSSTSSSGDESVSSVDLTVNFGAASGLDVTVDYAISGTAQGAGTDFTLANGTLSILAGNTSGTISIASIVDDLLDENNETVIVTLSNPSNAVLGGNQVYTYTINDNDATPVVAFNSTSSAGDESVSSTDLQVDLNAVSGLGVTVDYAVTGTASGGGTDYILADGTLTIIAGNASNNITIASIVDDLLDENNETVVVTLSNPVNATLGTNTVHTYTINDNDNAPEVDFNITSSNGAESIVTANLAVDLSAASGLNVTVDYAVSGTAAGGGTDFTLANGQLSIPAGNNSGTISIASIVDDLIDENNETVIVTLSNPVNATLGTDNVHTYTIMDNDGTPAVAFNSTSSNGLESVSSANLAVDLDAISGLNVNVDYTVTGTATGGGTDYTLADGTLTIPAGSSSANITIASIVDDVLDESNETIIVTLSNPTNAVLGTNTVHTYTIHDNEPTIEFVSTSSSALESVSSANLAVAISQSSIWDITVDYTVTGTATGGGVDYTLANGQLTIPSGDPDNTEYITIASIVDDVVNEGNETVIVTLSNPINGGIGTNTVHTYTIIDDEALTTVQFNSTSSNGDESTAAANLTVDLSTASSSDVDVDYTVTGTATGGGADYTLVNGVLTIPAGENSGTITIASIVDDLLHENDETVIVTLSSPVNAALGTNTVHTYTINDNDAAPLVAFNSINSSGLESVSAANLAVDISAVSALDVTVDYAVTGTASGSGIDYILANGALTILAGDVDNSENITIASIVDDLLDEDDETVIVTLSNPTNGTLGGNTVHTYTITDNDATPTVAFDLANSSGLESVSTANLTVDLSAASGRAVTVDYAITGTATGGGTDYTLANGTLNIPIGNTTGTITIASIVDDVLDEHNETVIVTLSNPGNAILGGNSVHTYTITDNDATPSIAFNSTSSSAAESVLSADIAVDLSAVSGRDVSVDYTISGTATAGGTDFTLANGTLTILAGDVTENITIAAIVDDLLDENNETVILTLSNPVNVNLGANTVHTYTINDNDATPTVAFRSASSSGLEALSSADLAVDISATSGLNISVDYAITGTATGGGTDYTLANGTLTILAGDVDDAENITIASIVDDLLDELDETVIVTLSNPVNATLGANTVHTYTILDNDATPVVAFNAAGSSGNESVATANLTVDLSAASGRTVTVDYTVTGTATGGGTDYTLANGTLTILAGNASGDITVASIVDDLLDEAGETVVVTLSNPGNAVLGGNTVHIFTITDNDPTPTIAFNSASSNGLESVSTANLAVDLSAVSGLNVSVDYAITGTAIGGGTDFTLADGTLTILAGSNSEDITIASIVDDLLDESNETVIVTLSNPVNATLGGNTVHTYTITDNDAAPIVAFNSTSSSGMESIASANLAVDISEVSGLNVSVDYTVTGTATGGGTDYTLANGTLTILAGDPNNSESITIASIVDDLLDEADETVIVTLSNPVNATLGANTVHTYTIMDNEGAPTIAFTSTASSGLESVTSADLAVNISAVSALNVSVDYAITGTATGSGTDYTLANGTLTILAGDADNTENITIASIVDDVLDEADETVIVTLSNPINANLGGNSVHTYTILDNDATPTLQFNTTNASGLESVSSANLAVDLSATSGRNVTADYTITGTAAGGGLDYTLSNGTLTIFAGDPDNTENITIAGIVNDLLDENDETVIVTLSNPVNATLGANTVFTYTILDDDVTPTIEFDTIQWNGAETVPIVDIAVDISATSGLNVSVDYAVTGTATGGGTDYLLADGTLTIYAGDADNTENISIGAIVNDLLYEADETVIITLSNPVNATLGPGNVHTYTILDNDPIPTVAFNNSASSGSETVASADLAVDLSAVSGLNVTVDYTVTGTATGGGTDYTLADGQLTITAGSGSNDITIASIVDDVIDETNETVIVTLSNPVNAVLGANTVHTYTINDNEGTPTIAFRDVTSQGLESVSSADVHVDLSNTSGLNISVDYAVTGTATGGGTDYTLANGTLTILAGDNSEPITIASIVDDIFDEPGETVILTLSNPVNATLGVNTVHTYTILDNEPYIAFRSTSSTGLESFASADLAVDLTATTTFDVTVDYTVTGTATGGGTDYTLANGTLTITAGNTTENITIGSIVDDFMDENDETVIVTLSNPGGAGLGANTVHTYTILDNDAPPVVEFKVASSSDLESTATANLVIELNAASSFDIDIDYAVTGTSTGGGTDYTLADGTLSIPAGVNSSSITIASIVDDLLDELDETVIVTLSNPVNATIGANSVHTYTILDNDAAPVVAFSNSNSSGDESVSSANIPVEISATSTFNVSVDYVVTGTATGGGTDYTLADGTLTILAGDADNTENITIASIVDDLLDENNETVTITLSNAVNATLGGNSVHTYTITDNDAVPTIAFNAASSNGLESIASTDLAVDISATSGLDITVDYTVSGTATGGGTDYTMANGTLTILAGDVDNSENITISSIVDDVLDESNETIIVTLSNPVNASLGVNAVHTYTINDNDGAPGIEFDIVSSNGSESVSSANLTVNLDAVSAQDVSVDYAVTGTATGAGTDYTLADGTLNILAGNLTGTISIASIVEDALDENDETVIVTLSNPTNAMLGTNTVHTYTINDNDNAPAIAFRDVNSNGLESVNSADLAVDISAVSALNVTVDYAISGTATGGGADFALANGTLTILAGDADNSENITIASIVDDVLDEVDETVIVTLSNPVNATLGANTVHTYTINDNDAPPTIAFNASNSSGAESIAIANLAVDLGALTTKDVTVDYSVSGTATDGGTDYTLANGTLTILAGNTTENISIAAIIDDALDETNETVIVTLSNPVNATLGANTVHTYTINDNDGAPSIAFNSTSSNGDESVATANLRVDLAATSALDVTVDYAVTGTATGAGTDYWLADGTLTITAGNTLNLITIASIIDDALDEVDETVVVTLSNPVNATLGANTVHTYTINDNDAAPVIAFSTTSSNGDESVASADLAVNIDAMSSLDITVDYAVTGTAAGAGTDYTLADGTLTILAGDADNSENITIAAIVDDLLDENYETVIVTLSNPTNATLGANTVHTYTINDNDAAPSIAFNSASSNGDESIASANLAVDISAASALEITVDYAVSGTAMGDGIDYTMVNGTLTLLAGSTSENITIASIVDDLLDENSETVVVTLSNPVNATLGGNVVHTYTINDNDAMPTIAFNSASSSGDESVSSANLAVDISAMSGLDVTVDYAVTGTATGADYTLADGTLSILAGDADNSEHITIGAIVDDLLDEVNETVIVTLSNPVNASLGANTVHTYTINDNDAPPTIAFSSSNSNADESVASASLTVDLTAPSSLDIDVNYSISGTAAGSGTDYTLADGTLTILAGGTNGTISIASIVDDLLDEDDETVIVTLSGPVNAVLGARSTHTYTILDNDAPPTIAFNSASSSGDESVASANLAVDLDAASALDITVDYSVTGTAVGSGIDYTLANGTLSILAGSTSENISIASIVDDLLFENDETVIVTLSNPSNATLGGATVHTYTITNNDAAPMIAFKSTSSNGDESIAIANLEVDLASVSALDATVDYTVTGTAAGSGTDYTLADGTLTIVAGAISGNITIASIVDDLLDENNETVVVTLSNPVNATLGANTVHTYTIDDNDAPPTIAFNSASSNGDESIASVDLVVDLGAVSALDVTVDYTVAGTATGSGTDYTLANGTLTITAGNTSGNITIASIADDLLDEVDETVVVTLLNPVNVSVGAQSVHTYTIVDNDITPSVAFASASSNGLESIPSADLTVTMSSTSTFDVTVDYSVTGTATAGSDYVLANGTLTIAAGSTSGTITVASIVDDILDETDETVVVTLSNPTNAVLGTATVHTYTIVDDESAPVAVDDLSNTTSEDTPITINTITSNDTDADGTIVLTSIILIDPANAGNTGNSAAPLIIAGIGSYTVDGAGTLVFTPEINFNGTADVQYTIEDDDGLISNAASVEIMVLSQNDAPIADEDAAVVNEGGTITIDIVNGDTDADGTLDLSSIMISNISNGTVIDNGDGTVSFTHNDTETTTAGFTYTIEDNEGLLSNVATVSITVTPVNDAPVVANDAGNIDEGQVLNGPSLLSNDSDIEGDPLTINTTPVVNVSDGTLTINPDGTYTYAPNSGFFGTDSFTYEVCDGQGGCATAQVLITINSVDYDGDGILDVDEGTVDTDGDGTPDYQDIDSDNDNILDAEEGNIDTDGDGIPNFRDLDSDGDGFSDLVETNNDCDADGTPNYLDLDRCDVIVPKGISPNGDGDNDEWIIQGIEQYPDNVVKVFNRWGNLVYQGIGYNNMEVLWTGQSEGSLMLIGKEVVGGSYFYVIELGEGSKPLSGYVVVKR